MSATRREVGGVGAAPDARGGPGRGTPPPTGRARVRLGRPGSAQRCQPEGVLDRQRRAGSRLVASTDSRGQAVRITSTVSRTASSRCSQLSTTSRPGPVAQHRDAGRQHVALDDVRPSAAASACGSAAGSVTGASSSTVRRVAPPGDLQGDPGLADAARPDDRDQPLARQQPVQRGDLRFPAEQPGRRPRCGARGRPRGRPGGAAGDVAFERAQRRRRVEAGLVGQPAPVLAPDAQRVGGLPGGRQRAHQQQHGRLAQRVGGVRRGGEPDDVVRPARVDGRGDQRVGHLAVQPRAALDGGRDRRDVGEVGEHRPAPERVRLAAARAQRLAGSVARAPARAARRACATSRSSRSSR